MKGIYVFVSSECETYVCKRLRFRPGICATISLQTATSVFIVGGKHQLVTSYSRTDIKILHIMTTSMHESAVLQACDTKILYYQLQTNGHFVYNEQHVNKHQANLHIQMIHAPFYSRATPFSQVQSQVNCLYPTRIIKIIIIRCDRQLQLCKYLVVMDFTNCTT